MGKGRDAPRQGRFIIPAGKEGYDEVLAGEERRAALH
jgi:hypothetical protein